MPFFPHSFHNWKTTTTKYQYLFGIMDIYVKIWEEQKWCCRRFFCEGMSGLPHARHSHFQPAPMDPLQGMAETLSKGGGTSRNVFLIKIKILRKQRSRGKKSWETAEGNTEVREGGGGKVLQALHQIFPAAPGRPVQEQRKSMRRKEKQRGAAMDWLNTPAPNPDVPLRVGGGLIEESAREKLSLKKARKKYVF